MKKKNTPAPTRRSTRPSLTREDRQIASDAYCVRHGIKFDPVVCWHKGDEYKYRLRLEGENDNITDIDGLAQLIRDTGMILDMGVIKSIIDILGKVIPKYMAQTGRAVRLGNLVMLKPYATGSLSKRDAKPDQKKNHVEIHAVACPALRYSLAKAKLKNNFTQGAKIDIVIAARNDAHGDEIHLIDEKNEECRNSIGGNNIWIPLTESGRQGEDGDIWLENSYHERIVDFKVVGSGPVMINAIPQPLVEITKSMDCTLVLRTYRTEEYAKEEDRIVTVLRHPVRLIVDAAT